MAELLEPQDIMFTPFEPKLKNRFIMQIDGINAYLIKTMNRPQIDSDEVILEHMNVTRYVKGKSRWQPLEITLYDPIVPSASQQVIEWIRLHHESATGVDGYSSEYKKDITFNVLSPNGEKIEQWILKGAFITDANFNDLSYAEDSFVDISLQLQYDYAILEF